MNAQDFTTPTKELIDNLKAVCTSYGLGNDGNEYKIITQAFLYKFMNDKFAYEVKELVPALKKAESWEKEIAKYTDKQYEMLLLKMSPDSAKLKREHYLSYLHNNQNKNEFAKLFDDTLRDIAIFNNEIFSVKTGTGAKVQLFDELSIIKTFNKHEEKEDFSVVVSYEEIKEKNYSFSAGQYFDVKIDYVEITPKEFTTKMNNFTKKLENYFEESKDLEKEIKKKLGGLKYG